MCFEYKLRTGSPGLANPPLTLLVSKLERSERAAANSPSRKEALVIGNSHTTAIEHALTEENRARVDVVNIATFDPVNNRNKVLPTGIVDLFQPERIYCTFGGSEAMCSASSRRRLGSTS
jgi:hypothetical protein